MSDSDFNLGDDIKILVVDDSHSFRWVLRDIFDKIPEFTVVGEASNGIEALDLLIKLKPNVIILDMEMPLMDGMTALQHLMIHTPTPTIMFSSLTKEGTARSFDALKNGAVDFVYKDSFFQGQMLTSPQKIIIKKVVSAAALQVKTTEPAFSASMKKQKSTLTTSQIIFCEECGGKVTVRLEKGEESKRVRCNNCGDHIMANVVEQYRRNNFISIIGSGEGGYSNLLKLIPKLDSEMSGSIIIVIYADSHHVDSFAEYLNCVSRMKVVRVRDGITIDGGNCYIASGSENVYLKPYSAHYTLRCSQKYFPGLGPIDMTMSSIASVFKEKVAGVILSGNEGDGEKGILAIQENDGSTFVLDSKRCLCKKMGKTIRQACDVEVVKDEEALAAKLITLHSEANKNTFTT
jgi:two-component system, chemotaxis family, protein-glutamate methylesterase/glutaminase